MQKIVFESFESDAELQDGADEGFERGFAEGYDAGLSAAKSEQTTLAKELVQNIADIAFKYDEARGELIRSMRPLFSALADKIFPQCISDGFTEQIVMILQKAGTGCPASAVTLCIHPAQHEALATALSSSPIDVALSPDPTLQPYTAVVQYDTGAIHIECDRLLDDIRAVLSSIDLIETRSETHGKPN